MSNITEKEAKEHLSKLIQVLYTLWPAVGEILMWIPYHFDPEDNPTMIAKASDRAMYFHPKFFRDLNAKEQTWVILHEMWHVALRHVDRRLALNAHPLIANLAMDVLINEGLKEVKRQQLRNSAGGKAWIEMPKNGIDVEWVEKATGKRLEKDWTQYDWYELYQYLLHNLPEAKEGKEGIVVDAGYFDDPAGKGKKLKQQQGMEGDLREGEKEGVEDGESETEEVKEHLWRSRIRQASAGDTKGNIIQPFLNLLPKGKSLPWYKLYKRYLQNWGVRHERYVSYARPHRRSSSGLYDCIFPSLRPSPGLLPITVVFDTSGSIPDEDLEHFAKHTDDFRKTFSLELEMWVVMVDVDVQEVTRLETGRTLAQYLKEKKVNYKGRGGTSFVPGLQQAAKLKTKLCVYFTDLCGDCGTKPKGMDVLWVINNEEMTPPFGRYIRINTR